MSKEEKNLDPEMIKLYELAFHLIPTVEDKAEKEFEKVKKAVSDIGNVIKESAPALINLAYTMEKSIDSRKQKYNTALFSWIKFETTPDKIAELKEDMDLNKSVLRYLITISEVETDTPSSAIAQFQGDDEMIIEESPEEPKDDSESEDLDKEAEEDAKNSGESTPEEIQEEVDKAIDDIVEGDK